MMSKVEACQRIEQQHEIEVATNMKSLEQNKLAIEEQLQTVNSVNNQLKEKVKTDKILDDNHPIVKQ